MMWKQILTKKLTKKHERREQVKLSDPVIKKPYVLPPVSCLNESKKVDVTSYEAELKQNAKILVDMFKGFGVEIINVDVSRGPSVTRYAIRPAAGVRIREIIDLTADIAFHLVASNVRIEVPIPGKPAIGIEVPNRNRLSVPIREAIDQIQYKTTKSKLTVALGKDVNGDYVYCDIARLPHLLIAGATGSGKTVCVETMIISILFNATPDEVKFLMIDPKFDLFKFNGIPHLLAPVVTDPQKASGALGWAVTEMKSRYKTFSENNVRNIKDYNSVCEARGKKKLPQIVIFIDELFDLMVAASKDVEDSICYLAQMARAAGIYLVIATQSLSDNVLTGMIKANIPSCIALSVYSEDDSKIIIGSGGAEKLLGNGDMLYYPSFVSKPLRVQGCSVFGKEIENVIQFIKKQAFPEYNDEVIEEIERQASEVSKEKAFQSRHGTDDNGNADYTDD